MSNNFMKSGERFVPSANQSSWTKAHHISRYLFALSFVKNKVVVECGCGVGYGTNILAAHAFRVIGGDLSFPSVQYAGLNYSQYGNEKYVQFDCLHLPFTKAMCDVVICFELIEHLEEQNELLNEIDRILKPDGLLIISTPERIAYNQFLGSPNPFHKRELTYSEFQEILEARFLNVSIYWQTLNSPLFELYQQSVQIAELRSQVDAIRNILRHPWKVVRHILGYRKLRPLLPLGAKPDAPIEVASRTFELPQPEHFTFESESAGNSKSIYMVAVCRKSQK